jgi:hypothetical protein
MWDPIDDTPVCRQDRKGLVNKIHELSDEIQRLNILLKKAQEARDAYRKKTTKALIKNQPVVNKTDFMEVVDKVVEAVGIGKCDAFNNRDSLVLISLLLHKKGYNKGAIGRSINKDRTTVFRYISEYQSILPKDLHKVFL